ncbi:MAG TPA: hypothetical protein PL131_08010 [Methylotenera sp.]|nr:hypothetical protein [Methylotenera sp.]HPN01046.1 hypothetical protein [Methylotenera sp.]
MTSTESTKINSSHNVDAASTDSKLVVPGWNAADPTDGRAKYDYKSRYPLCIRVQMFSEALYLLVILIISTYHLVWMFGDSLPFWQTQLTFTELNRDLQKMFAFFTAGAIGGTMFGLKYLHHVAGKGLWNEDRRIWRIFTPFLTALLAAMFGIIVDGGFIHLSTQVDGKPPYSSYVSIGFFTGYFADTALAKLQEIATFIFGAEKKAASLIDQ